LDQLRVPLQRVDDLDGAMASLGQGVLDDLRLPIIQDLPVLPGGLLDRFQPPVLGLQDQHTAPRVQHHEIGLRLLWAHGHVVPEQVIVFELLLQAFGQAPLA